MHRNFTLALPVTLLFVACTFKAGDLGELTEATGTEDPSTSSATDPVTTSAGTAISGMTNGESSDSSGSEETGSTETTEGLTPADGVDILFVIDNSGSMAAHQQRLSTAIPALVAPLEAAGLDLRIAVTTTDAGNPRCPTATYTPENGAFQARSCREAVADLRRMHQIDPRDVTKVRCMYSRRCTGPKAPQPTTRSPPPPRRPPRRARRRCARRAGNPRPSRP